MSDGAIIALIPAGASGEEHTTLVYFDTAILAQMRQIAAGMAQFWTPFSALVTAHQTFGSGTEENPFVSVATLDCTALWTLNETVRQYSISEFGFNPHISEQPGTRLPVIGSFVDFDRIGVWNHDDRMAWRFGTGARCAP